MAERQAGELKRWQESTESKALAYTYEVPAGMARSEMGDASAGQREKNWGPGELAG